MTTIDDFFRFMVLQVVVDFVYTDMLALTEQNRERDDMAINGMTTIKKI